ncbi:hypothetical protein COOONC_18918 [Cooperia oncophora]
MPQAVEPPKLHLIATAPPTNIRVQAVEPAHDSLHDSKRSVLPDINFSDRVVITRMLYIAAFDKVHSIADKGVVLTRCREIADEYREFDAVPFDTEVGMVDVILQVPYVTYFIPLFVLTGYAIMSVILIGNLATSLVAIGSAVMVFLESYCISSLIGVVLNPFTAAFLIVISVFAAKFSTHICYAFQQALESEYENAETNRLTRTFQKVFIPEAMVSQFYQHLVQGCVYPEEALHFGWFLVFARMLAGLARIHLVSTRSFISRGCM